MKLESVPIVIDFDPFEIRSVPGSTHNIGDAIFLADGRIFRYAKAGANISQGKLQLSPAIKANHTNIAVASAVKAGSTTVTVTLGATAAVENEYAEGYMVVNNGSGAGTTYKIASHPAANASSSLTLTLADPLDEDLSTTSRVTLVYNSYNGVSEGTSNTQNPAGVPMENVSNGNFCWLQTAGVASVLAGGTISAGSWVVADTTTAGAVAAASTTIGTLVTQALVGRALVAGTSGEYRPVFLEID